MNDNKQVISSQSSYQLWRSNKGRLSMTPKQRIEKFNLFPFYLSYDGTKISGGEFSFVMTFQVLAMIGIVIACFYYSANALSGRGGDSSSDSFGVDTLASVPLEESESDSIFTIVSDSAGGGEIGGLSAYNYLPPRLTFFDFPDFVILHSFPSSGSPAPEVQISQNIFVANTYLFHVSSYYPAYDDNFCLDYDYENQDCLSPMTSGLDWRAFNGRALACPADWLGDWVDLHYANNGELLGRFQCLDTGTNAVLDANGYTASAFWLDSGMVLDSDAFHATVYHLETVDYSADRVEQN